MCQRENNPQSQLNAKTEDASQEKDGKDTAKPIEIKPSREIECINPGEYYLKD